MHMNANGLKVALLTVLALAMTAAVTGAEHASVRRTTEAWQLLLPGPTMSMPTSLAFDAPPGHKGGAPQQPHRQNSISVSLAPWEYVERSRASMATIPDSTLSAVFESTPATRVVGNLRTWTSTIKSLTGGMACKFSISRDGAHAAIAAIACAAAPSVGGAATTAQWLGDSADVRLRATSAAGALVEQGQAKAMREVYRRGTKDHMVYAWEALGAPCAAAFTTAGGEVVLTFSAATAADVLAKKPPTTAAVVVELPATLQMQRPIGIDAAQQNTQKILKAGQVIINDDELVLTNENIKYHGYEPASQWYWGLGGLLLYTATVAVWLSVIFCNMKTASRPIIRT